MDFLKAEWKNLALFNYEVDRQVLEKYVPAETEIDICNNKCYVSLVGFLFKETKVLGLKVPFHVDFEELNLRFYVKRFENGEWRRGVVFIKEIDSEAEFITEHYFGYTKIDSAKTFEYEVRHP